MRDKITTFISQIKTYALVFKTEKRKEKEKETNNTSVSENASNKGSSTSGGKRKYSIFTLVHSLAFPYKVKHTLAI